MSLVLLYWITVSGGGNDTSQIPVLGIPCCPLPLPFGLRLCPVVHYPHDSTEAVDSQSVLVIRALYGNHSTG